MIFEINFYLQILKLKHYRFCAQMSFPNDRYCSKDNPFKIIYFKCLIFQGEILLSKEIKVMK